MGTYRYQLTSKTRNILVDGEPQPSNLLRFSSKVYGFRIDKREEALEVARHARFSAIWKKLGPPKYVVVSDYVDGSHVYGDWKQGHWTWYDSEPVPALFLGVLVKQGRSFALKRYGNLLVPNLTQDQITRMGEMASGRWIAMEDYATPSFQKDRPSRIFCEQDRDLVLAKLLTA